MKSVRSVSVTSNFRRLLSCNGASPVKYFYKVFRCKIQILWVIASVLGANFMYFTMQKASLPSYGFASYYTASKLFIEGEDAADFYNDDWFSSNVEKYVPGVYEVYLVNMPTTTLLFLPIANFEYKTARVIWIFFNLFRLALIVGLIIRRIKFYGIWFPIILILFFSFQPLYANISFGQVYIFILFLLVKAWFTYRSSNEALLGIILGWVFIIKTAGLLLWVLISIQKKWKSLMLIFVTVTFLILISITLL